MSGSNLQELGGFEFPVLVSPGTEARAGRLAVRCGRAYAFFAHALDRRPDARLLVLGPEHWQDYTGSPMFGVPQTIDQRTVVVAGRDAELWAMIVPPPEALGPDQAQALRDTYGRSDGSVAVGDYMDLLAVHELGHLFVDQAAGRFDHRWPRRWLVELFCNLALHAYTEAEEPDALRALTVFPRVTVGLGHDHLAHRSLDAFERLYADMEPPNFIWYLSRLHMAAEAVHVAGGLDAMRRLFRVIVEAPDGMEDDALATLLAREAHSSVADVLLAW